MTSHSNRDRLARILRFTGFSIYLISFALPASFQIGRDQTLRSGFALFLGAATMCVPAIFGVLISLATLSITELQMGVIATSVIANIPMLIILFRSRRSDGRPLGRLATWQLVAAIQASLVALMPSISLRQIALPYGVWVLSLWVICGFAYLIEAERGRAFVAATTVTTTPPAASASSQPSTAAGRP